MSEIASQLRLEIGQARAEESVLSDTYGPALSKDSFARKSIEKAFEKALDAEFDPCFCLRLRPDYPLARPDSRPPSRTCSSSRRRISLASNTASVKLKEHRADRQAEPRPLSATASPPRPNRHESKSRCRRRRARIISPAQPAVTPSAPKAPVVLARQYLPRLRRRALVRLGFSICSSVHQNGGVRLPAPPLRKRHLAAG